jgi:hypothetical protein
MELPTDRKIHELKESYVWISDEGIVFSKPKPHAVVDQTIEEIKSEMDKLRQIVGNKKVCLVGEPNPNSKPLKKELRDFAADEIASVTKAMALVAGSPVARMLANLFFSFKPPTYPVKMFATEKEATEWIRQYL